MPPRARRRDPARAQRAASAPPSQASRDLVRRRKLLRAAGRGDLGARRRLVAAHLGLVRRVASAYRDLGVPYDDLVQEGSIGLLDAVQRYDTARHQEFEAFARFRVRRAIRNALTDQARLVRLPKQMVERRRAVAKAEAQLAAGGRAATPRDLAAATGLSEDALLEARAALITPMSLDAVVASDGTTLEGVIPDAAAPDPEREAVAAEEARQVRAAVAGLSPRQREVVTRRFGLDGCAESVASVAADLKLSKRRMRTIEHDALHRLGVALEPTIGDKAS